MADATECDKSIHDGELSPTQEIAVEALATGKRDAEAAELAGVNRVTVTRWRLNSAPFRKAIAQRRAEIWGGTADRLRALLPQAVETLANALNTSENPVPIAIALLKLAGPLPVSPVEKDQNRSMFEECFEELRNDPLVNAMLCPVEKTITI